MSLRNTGVLNMNNQKLMKKEDILLKVLNEHGDFENVRTQFDENDLACIFESMERYKGQTLPIDSVVKFLPNKYCPQCGEPVKMKHKFWCSTKP